MHVVDAMSAGGVVDDQRESSRFSQATATPLPAAGVNLLTLPHGRMPRHHQAIVQHDALDSSRPRSEARDRGRRCLMTQLSNADWLDDWKQRAKPTQQKQ